MRSPVREFWRFCSSSQLRGLNVGWARRSGAGPLHGPERYAALRATRHGGLELEQPARIASAHVLDLPRGTGGTSGPLTVGVLYTGMIGAAIAYPIGAIASAEYYAHRLAPACAARDADHAAARPVGIGGWGWGRGWRGRLSAPAERTTAAGIRAGTEAGTTAEASATSYVLHPEQLVRADSVSLLIDGREGYPEMLRAIDDAKESIDLETYILRNDHTGRRFATALSNAARRGVRTRLLYDAVGALGLPDTYVTHLTSAGVDVAVFRPISSIVRRGILPFNRRDHRKILIVDKRTGFIGGLNISDDNAPKEDGGMGWRDTHLRIDGAVVAAAMQKLFEETWRLADRVAPASVPARIQAAPSSAPAETPVPPLSPRSSVDSVLVQVLGNKEFLQRVRLRRAYVHAIRNAQRYILIENAYFIPDRGIRRALYRAVKRGVVVAAVVAMYSDVKVAALASRSLYSELIAGGVKLFEYPISMMHSKVAVVDDVWSMVGSYNLDHRSLMHNLEAGVMAVDPRLAQLLRERIVADIEHSREVTKDFHEARPWDNVMMEALAYQVRYWL